MALGLRVVRGPDWSHNDADGGEGHLGTVVGVTGDNSQAIVLWDIGNTTHCKIGKSGKHDVRVFDNASVGVIFKGLMCIECKSKHFFGMRWKCKSCDNVDLCSICYFRGKHDQNHPFIRYTAPHMNGVDVPPRFTSTSLTSMGMYPKAKVERGKDWAYSDQDGGVGIVGKVVHIRAFGEDLSHRNAVGVMWPSGEATGYGFAYRLGYKGKVDLKCTESAMGFEYFREHLPVLDLALIKHLTNNTLLLQLKKGDIVCINISNEELRELQRGHGGYSVQMDSIIGKVGIIDSFTDDGDVVAIVNNDRWILNPKALSKVNTVSIGDTVRIKSDYDTVKALQTGHGGWNEEMKTVLGKVGRIERITSRKDVVVAFGKKYWVFNKACVVPAPGEAIFELKQEKDFTLSTVAGLTDGLGLLLAQLMLADAAKRAGDEQFLKEAAAGNSSMIQKMLKGEPNLCNKQIKGTTALICACFEGHEDVVKVLLAEGAKSDIPDKNGNTALLASIASDKENIVKLLIKFGADVNLANKNGRSPIHVAAKCGSNTIVKMLLEHRCNINARDVDGDTALHDAISGNKDNIVTILVEACGIDFTVVNSKHFNCLHFATLKGCKIAVDKITGKRPQVTNIAMNSGVTALHIAAVNNRTEIANILLIKGKADTEMAESNGRTPLHMAAIEGYYEFVKLILDFNADPSAVDKDGNTPLHCVLGVEKRQPPIVVLLGGQQGNDKANRIKIASLLIKFGAKIDARNKGGKQAIDMTNNEEIKTAVRKVADTEKGRGGQRGRTRPNSGQKEQEMFTQEMNVPCFICFRQQGIVTARPCGHRCMCPSCCFKVEDCIVCLKPIEDRVGPDGQKIVPLLDLCKVQ